MLGSVELSTATHAVDLGPRKQQAVLAALLVDAGRPVPIEKIIDRVWGDAAPTTARGAVHSYITRLRRALAEANAADGDDLSVEYQSAGYVLHAPQDQVDLHRFRRLLDEARATRGDDPGRAELLWQALGLWRGQPLTGLTGAWAEAVRREASRRRLGAVLRPRAAGQPRGEARPGNGQWRPGRGTGLHWHGKVDLRWATTVAGGSPGVT
ncbi:winged helix-turn-helix domain-containing protein [Sphaerisporangium sp. NPDC051017]|uniref:AfsR/SARP family transcriptional regulator n=1 Tax=Sphaerisporangium sp. NPDC051017 TaxID=3154636 RepID=UPI0034321D26